MTAIFITATGTDVGQTRIAASLVRLLRQTGRQVDAIKPIVSGFDTAHAAVSDPGILLAALGQPFSPAALDRVSPWRFRAAQPPDLAAREEGRSIDVDGVIAYCKNAISERRDILVIEGVGGIMVPLNEERTILDVMMALKLPIILVGGSYPGALSHTLTALDSLFQRELDVLATIISESVSSTMPLDEMVASVSRFTTPVLGVPRSRR